MTKAEIMEYAELTDRQCAYNLLLLLGADAYDGDDYDEFLDELEQEA